jgi:hypothetical protein
LLTAAALATFAAFSSGRAADQTPKLLTEHFMIDAVDPGTKLYIRNKRPEGMLVCGDTSGFRQDPVVAPWSSR